MEEESARVLGSEVRIDGGDLLARSAPRGNRKRGERESGLAIGTQKWEKKFTRSFCAKPRFPVGLKPGVFLVSWVDVTYQVAEKSTMT